MRLNRRDVRLKDDNTTNRAAWRKRINTYQPPQMTGQARDEEDCWLASSLLFLYLFMYILLSQSSSTPFWHPWLSLVSLFSSNVIGCFVNIAPWIR